MTEGDLAPAFTPDEERTLSSVLDQIIPPSPDGRLPGAGALGLARHIDGALDAMPGLRPMVGQGLAALDERARDAGAADFAALTTSEQAAALRELEAAQPGFLPALVFNTYTAYYQHGRVSEALGLEGRPPHPRGYDMAPSDLTTLLDPVREREKLYREP